MRSKFRNNAIGWTFVGIGALLIIFFYFYPMVSAFILSLHTGRGNNMEFIGFQNYIRAFSDPTLRVAIKNTFTFLIIQVPIMIILGLSISVLLNKATLRFKSFFRVAIFLPAVTSLVAYSIIFKDLFSANGLVNRVLLNLSIISESINWLGDPFWAKVLIIIAITWRWTGYNMIFYLSALQNIDESIYEAASIDGASAYTQFTRITIPILKPVILFTSVTSTIGTLQLFDEVMNITGGGPGTATTTISKYIYDLSFVYAPDFGYAATVSYFIVVIVIILSILQFALAGDQNE